eukprot:CAMPEP_0197532170 /NCGR_PEP_ID=MMETSP1318-20131121/38757_1 /TAXON_ID=552666 /ORGANISM="Partenskyella glossopodia, Strain RCC365" /LENGTH=97 /DNA_ID=CAMNT_0043088647 /DNA_START=544 /DNA_END=834 /DNA_ORIENTATION=+
MPYVVSRNVVLGTDRERHRVPIFWPPASPEPDGSGTGTTWRAPRSKVRTYAKAKATAPGAASSPRPERAPTRSLVPTASAAVGIHSAFTVRHGSCYS